MSSNAVSFALKAIERKTNPPLSARNSHISHCDIVTRHSVFSRSTGENE
jgi:hypothetical protein